MDDITIVRLDVKADFPRIRDLYMQAADYIRMEKGIDPDDTYIRADISEAPPHLPPEDVFQLGLERPDGTLAGIIGCLRNFYEPGEWYMGLLLLEPAARGVGLGRFAATHVIDMARADGGTRMRIAVLDINKIGRKFWAAMGFVHERTVPGDTMDDGKTRHVLNLTL